MSVMKDMHAAVCQRFSEGTHGHNPIKMDIVRLVRIVKYHHISLLTRKNLSIIYLHKR